MFSDRCLYSRVGTLQRNATHVPSTAGELSWHGRICDGITCTSLWVVALPGNHQILSDRSIWDKQKIIEKNVTKRDPNDHKSQVNVTFQ